MDEKEHQALWEAVRAVDANWRPGHNTITELAPEERRRRLGYTPGDDELSLEARELLALGRHIAARVMDGEPKSVDWRSMEGNNYVTIVKDQGSCGSCVSFGTVATIESRARIVKNVPINATNGNTLLDLSEAQLFYCGNKGSSDPCAQGWRVSPALAYTSDTGLVPSTCFPYTPGNQLCNPCVEWKTMLTKVASSQSLDVVAEMKDWLRTNGPLITGFNVYSDFWAYTGGVYQRTGGTPEGGHCVSCIGFDDRISAWLCKNSWGTGWGEGGFFWIGYGECGIDASMWAVDSFTQIYTAPLQRQRAGGR